MKFGKKFRYFSYGLFVSASIVWGYNAFQDYSLAREYLKKAEQAESVEEKFKLKETAKAYEKRSKLDLVCSSMFLGYIGLYSLVFKKKDELEDKLK